MKKYGPQGSLRVIDAEEKKDLNFPEIARSGGLFSSVRLVIIKSALAQFSQERLKEIREFFKSDENIVTSKDVVIIFWEREVLKKDNVLLKYFRKNAKLEEFPKLGGTKILGWISSHLKEINPKVKISRPAAEKLAVYTAEDSEQVNSELLKLANFKEKGEIEEADIDHLVSAKLNSTIFETIEAASSGNKKRALALLHSQLGNEADPFYILSMYVYQFRNLLKIGEYFFQGITNKFNVAKKAGLHPYVVQKTLPQLKNFTLLKLKNIYKNLQKIDMEAKTGKVEINLALDKFLVKL